MASIENKSRPQVSVKNRDDLTKLFPHDKLAAASAYVAELTKDGHKPSLMVLDEAYLVRFEVKGKRCSRIARTWKEAETIKKQIEAEQHRGLFVDYTRRRAARSQLRRPPP